MPPATRDSFAKTVEGLVRKFEADRDTYLSAGYGEAQARSHFITPFFKALGWDVENEAAAPYHLCEVWEEKGETEGRPDYAFRINGQTRFFIEAKAPSEQLENTKHILQTKSYAWNSRDVHFAGLTDFEDFYFFDASLTPDERHPHRGERIRLTYREYTSNIELLWELSRERVAAGSLDQFLAKDRKSIRERKPVDASFLDELTESRRDLAKEIHALNLGLDARMLNEVVQRLLDRIVFIRIAEDRKVLESRELLGAVEWWEEHGGRRSIMEPLVELFREINEDFNGEIFKPHPCEEVKVDSAVVARIIQRLYPPKSPYRFDVIGVELLGSIYERYLGNTLHVTAKQVRLEEKPEVRKAGGVYYTPKYIVDYIVKETVGKLLEGKTPKEVQKLRILDPACGSGSFLIGAFQYLIDWHLAYYQKHPKEARVHPMYPEVVKNGNGRERLSFNTKCRILRHNLYGVDLDPQAVEIAMMSLYLKTLEDEHGMLGPKHEKLPELKYNIRCGNSLIAPDIEKEHPLAAEERDRIRPFDWHSREEGYGDILKASGFDAVIGNPPYIQLSMEEFRDERLNAYLIRKYGTSMGRLNTFGLFIEQAKRVVRVGGRVGYIIPNTFLTQGYYEELRRRVLTETVVHRVALVPGMAFQDAVVENVLLVIEKQSEKTQTPSASFELVELTIGGQEGRRASFAQVAVLENHECAFFTTFEKPALAMKTKLDALPHRFGELTNINQAIALKYDRAACLSPSATTKKHKPVLDGRDIDRYFTGSPRNFFKFDVSKIHSCKREDIFLVPEKIFFRRVGSQIVATLDTQRNYALNTLVVVTPRPDCRWPVRALLGLLNSKVLNFYYTKFLKSSKKVFSEIQARQLAQLPVPTVQWDDNVHKQRVEKLSRLVDEILERRKRGPEDSPAIVELSRNIDQVVFDLYGVTSEERKMIEESVPQ